MSKAIGFDVYRTLVDPLEMNQHLSFASGRKKRSLRPDLARKVL